MLNYSTTVDLNYMIKELTLTVDDICLQTFYDVHNTF